MIQLDGSTHINSFSLKFSDPDIESEFRQNFIEESTKHYRILFYLVLILQFLRMSRDFIFGDFSFLPGYLINVPLAVICLILSNTPSKTKYIPITVTALILSISLSNAFFANPEFAWYTVSIYSVLIFGIFTVAKLFYTYSFSLALVLNLVFLSVEIFIFKSDGRALVYSFLPILMTDLIGGIAGYTIEYHMRLDFFTTKKLAENITALSESNKVKNEILGIAVHDIKNPLSVVNVYSDLILLEPSLSEKSRKQVGIIKDSTEKMSGIVNYLLELAQIETGEISVNFIHFNVTELVQNVIQHYTPLADSKNQKLDSIIQKNVFFRGDPAKISSIFENLISNGIKYTPFKKSIQVFLEHTGKSLIFTVEDEGPGISKEDAPKLFQKWQKLQAKPTGNEISSGLGLSITKRFVDLHYGKIKVETVSGTGGSRFIAEFPIFLEG